MLLAMAIGGSPQEIRDDARRVRGWAEALDATTDQVRGGQGVRWVGVAAEKYRDRLGAHARAVGSSRTELLDLARALDHLADELEERQAAIRRAAALVEDAVDGARNALGRLWGIGRDLWSDGEKAASEAAERLIDTVGDALPPAGSPSWLDLARTIGR